MSSYKATVPAQFLHDLRDVEEFASGNELADFFERTLGDSCPSGWAEVDTHTAIGFVQDCCHVIARWSPSMARHAARAEATAKALIGGDAPHEYAVSRDGGLDYCYVVTEEEQHEAVKKWGDYAPRVVEDGLTFVAAVELAAAENRKAAKKYGR